MGKGLVSQMRKVRYAVLGLALVVLALVAMALVELVDGVERPELHKVKKQSVSYTFPGAVYSMEESTPTPKPELVSNALAVATISNYANLEATRIAKMAAAIMDMGGTYTASCESVYDTASEKVEAEYRIVWFRAPSDILHSVVKQEWYGETWGECLAKMTAWKGGE